MAGIFAGIDAAGAVRFVADVPRGLACGCFCPDCRAPLVARQGNELEWHFAHEQSQERPECRAGAMNLLRRLVAEEFIARGRFDPPPFAMPHPVPYRSPIVWTDRAIGQLRPLPFQSQSSPLAEVDLELSGTARVYVGIGKERPPAADNVHAAGLVWCPDPEPGQLRSEAGARAFAKERSTVRWIWLPDTQGRVAAAKQEADAEMRQKLAGLRSAAQFAGARWAGIRRTMDLNAASMPPRGPEAETQPSSAASLSAPPWAPGLAPRSSIHYRLLDDGTQWVLYQTNERLWRLSPVPQAFDGWDETFPPTIARPGAGNWLDVPGYEGLLDILQPHTKSLRIDSDPDVIERCFGVGPT